MIYISIYVYIYAHIFWNDHLTQNILHMYHIDFFTYISISHFIFMMQILMIYTKKHWTCYLKVSNTSYYAVYLQKFLFGITGILSPLWRKNLFDWVET